MEKSFGLHFHLKKNKVVGDSESTVYMRITVDQEFAEISTKRKCEKANWNSESGRMNKKHEAARDFNAYLDTLQQKVFEAKRKLLELDQVVTPENIKTLLLGKSINSRQKRMLMEIFTHHNDQMQALVGKEYAPGMLVRYQTSFRHTRSFLNKS